MVRLRSAICWLWLTASVLTYAAGAPAADQAVCDARVTLHRMVVTNWWQTNCYLLVGKTGKALIIDPGDAMEALPENKYRATGAFAEEILATLRKNRWTLKYIVLTHGHLDHIGAIGALKQRTGAQVLMHAGDVRDGYPKDAPLFVEPLAKVDRTLEDGELLTLDGMALQVLHTPGHSPGGLCLRTRQRGVPTLFSGDTLFYHSIGRTNFRDGSGDQALLLRSIRERLFTLPEGTVVLPGHYDPTTIGEEQRNNPFLQPEPAAPENK